MLAELESHLYSVSKPKHLSQILGLEKTALEFCASLVMRYLTSSGIKVLPKEKISINACLDQLEIQSRFHRMFDFLLSLILDMGIITIREDTIHFRDFHTRFLSPENSLDKIRTLYPKFYLFFSFLEKCARFYPEVLSGKKHANEILFPPENPFLLKKLYQNTPKIGHEELYLHLAKEFLHNRLSKESDLIEIGGGQGILTQILLPELHESLGSYLFTDIGASFSKDASAQFNRYPKLKTALLDASLDPAKQGFELESFDALVGFNVVHATHDVAKTLQESIKLIKKNGVMCLVETVRQQAWIDMIYGLTEGWWLFKDFRSNSPLLSIEQWEQVLGQVGFCEAVVFPTDLQKRAETDTALIVIEKIGNE